jgi:UDP-GlcNAc3NAcA epimerase
MYDALLTFSKIAEQKYSLKDIVNLDNEGYHLATIHRPSNTDNEDNLRSIIEAFSELDKNILWPVHPRNKTRLKSFDIPENLHLIDPLSYFKMMVLLKNCDKVITDSGGLQKEAYWMKKQCITVRNETEWVETLHGNWNTLTGPNKSEITKSVSQSPSTEWKKLYGDGSTSDRIAEIVKRHFS